jgi:hypothetical protein
VGGWLAGFAVLTGFMIFLRSAAKKAEAKRGVPKGQTRDQNR